LLQAQFVMIGVPHALKLMGWRYACCCMKAPCQWFAQRQCEGIRYSLSSQRCCWVCGTGRITARQAGCSVMGCHANGVHSFKRSTVECAHSVATHNISSICLRSWALLLLHEWLDDTEVNAVQQYNLVRVFFSRLFCMPWRLQVQGT
jgi:hypothetical protein